MILKEFESIRPAFEALQNETLNWLIDAHCEAQARQSNLPTDHSEIAEFRSTLSQTIKKVGCKPEFIHKRGHILSDYLHRDWDAMQVYSLNQSPSGANLETRMELYQEHVEELFDTLYPLSSSPPDDLIHVSCTGYVSPSGAQALVAKRNWGKQTTVTHAYHMGCYGSIPALRIAQGFCLSQKKQVDIVHTEICSLHVNPAWHRTDQLVTQSLFADGFIKYSASNDANEPHLKVHAFFEEILTGTSNAMTWRVSSRGFEMSLSKEVPFFIAQALDSFLIELCKKANCYPEKACSEAYFAIHPGGPKILQHVKRLLHLKDWQIQESLSTLKTYGNMSSATLPHIWKSLLEDQKVPSGSTIISLAFGPGLTICGSVMEKCG